MGIDVALDEADKVQFDPSVVEGLDPAYKYRWGRKDQRNLLMHSVHGYEPVEAFMEKSVLGDRTRVKQGEQLTTNLEWGDLILLRTSVENFDKRMARERAMILRRTRGVTANYRQAIKNITGSEEHAYEEHDPKKSKSMRGMNQVEFEAAMASSPEVERG